MKAKGILSVLLVAVMFFSLCAIPVSAVDTSSGGFDYQTVGSSEAKILGLTKNGALQSETVITIPSSLDANLVTAIGDGAFRDNSTVQQYILPNTIEEIGISAFYNSTALKSITIPANVVQIGITAFAYCSVLETVTFNAGSLTAIPNYMFVECTSLDRVIIPSTVGTIGEYAFLDCTALKQLYIPSSVSTIPVSAFKGCTNLTIYGEAGSTAEVVAGKNNIPFIALNNDNKSALNALLSSAESILEKSDRYLPTGIANLQTAYDNALPLKGDFFATPSQISTAVSNLQAAANTLKLYAMVTLEQNVNDTNALLQSGVAYTEASLALVNENLVVAENLVRTNSKDYAIVLNANQALSDAVSQLVYQSYYDLGVAIQTATDILAASDIGNYTTTTVNSLKTQLNYAKTTYNSTASTNDSYLASLENLNSAINALHLKSYDTLQSKIDEYKEFIENTSDKYTMDSLNVLTAAIEQAETVINSNAPTNDQLLAEIDNLTAAKKSLVKVIRGDINEDRKISAADLVLLQRYQVRIIDFDKRQRYVADYSNDGQISLKDNILLQRYLLGS